MHAKIVQIKILYENECTKNVHQIIDIHIYKKIHIHIYKSCTDCTKLVQSANWKEFETWNVCFLHMQTMCKLCSTYTISMFFVHIDNGQTIQNVYKC